MKTIHPVHFQQHNHHTTFNLVTGPFRCGKSTYIRQHYKMGDRVLKQINLTHLNTYHTFPNTFWYECNHINEIDRDAFQYLLTLGEIILHEFRNNGTIHVWNFRTLQTLDIRQHNTNNINFYDNPMGWYFEAQL